MKGRGRRRRAFWAVLIAAFVPLFSDAQDTRTVTEPSLPPVCTVLIADLVAPAGNTAMLAEADDTARIQQAIHACPAGRAVRFALGNGHNAFLSGPLVLKSGVTLIVDAGVTLYGTTNRLAYDTGGHRCGTNDAAGHGCAPFISANDTEGSGLMGAGVIDGQGGRIISGRDETWWQIARRAQKEGTRQNVPRLVEVNRSRNFTLYGITLANSANFHVTLNRVDGFTAWGVRVDSPADARNTDGIDPVSSRNITIAHSFIRTGDDNIAIKAGKMGLTENISVLHNHFYNGHGMSIGSETEGGVRNILVEDLTMDGATSGLRIKSDRSRGGKVASVRYRSICLQNIRAPLDFDTQYDPKATGGKIPTYGDIVLERVHSLTPGRLILRGFDESHPLSFAFDNVVIDGDSMLQMAHARVNLGAGPVRPLPGGDDVQISGKAGEAAAEDCSGRFVPFPARAQALASNRPQLSEAEAAKYSYAEVMNYHPVKGSDPWDPLADALIKAEAAEPDYIVDGNAPADGRKTFQSVQAAVNRAVNETGRIRRVFILVKPGLYRGLLYVPEFAAPITLLGSESDASRTCISADLDANVTGSRYRELFSAQFAAAPPAVADMYAMVAKRDTVSTPGSAIAWIRNAGFQAKNITFENIYNRAHGDAFNADGSAAIHSQGVALMVDDADKVQFENVRFTGYQDTLFLHSSSPGRSVRSFFHRSYIEGDLDFIFGEATGYFYRSEIKSLGDRKISYATAPDTHYSSRYGLVFNESRFTHDGSDNALAGRFYLTRQWFRGQRCTPYGGVDGLADYRCTVATTDSYNAPKGTISRDVLENVGKVVILNSQIGSHIDKSHPWSDWNARGTLKFRPVQYNSDDYWNYLQAAGIDPVKQLGYAAHKSPVDAFLAEYRNRDE